jgi:hypothetical protein
MQIGREQAQAKVVTTSPVHSALRSYLGLKNFRLNTWVSFGYTTCLCEILAPCVMFLLKCGEDYCHTTPCIVSWEMMTSAIDRRNVNTVCGHAILAEV